MTRLITYRYEVFAAVLTAAVLVLAWLMWDLRRRWARVFKKRAAKEALGEVIERLLALEAAIEDIEPRLKLVQGISERAVQRVGFMRFNPFEHTGGDQSFALALLDRKRNGIIISSLYTRDGVRVYAKEIQEGVARQPLSGEEQTVLEKAME